MAIRRLAIPGLLLPLLTLLGTDGAMAESTQGSTLEAGMIANEVDTSGSTSVGSVGARLAGSIPLTNYLGVALSGDYLNSSVRTRKILEEAGGPPLGTRSACKFDSTDGDIKLFAHAPLGKIAIGYGLGQLSSSCGDDSVFTATGEDKLTTHRYSFDAEVYLGDFTLAASRVSTDLDGGSTLDTNTFTASWYPLDSLRVSVSGNDLYGQNTYGFTVEHQPEALGNSLGVYVGYSSSEQSPRTSILNFGVMYYFGQNVDLKRRDREYR
ncbi:MAG TPA: hypothetical protein VGN07_16525 [Steroidobacteraceae bacterium]|jgi:hypothetical protein